MPSEHGPPLVRHAITVDASQEHAFATFTQRT